MIGPRKKETMKEGILIGCFINIRRIYASEKLATQRLGIKGLQMCCKQWRVMLPYFKVQNNLRLKLLSLNLGKHVTFKIYLTITLQVVLQGCETWYLTLREECMLKEFEISILRRIFGPKSDANGKWRGLHNDEFHSLYRSPNIVSLEEGDG